MKNYPDARNSITTRKNTIFVLTALMLIATFCFIGCNAKKSVEKKKEISTEKKEEIEKIIAKHRDENMELSVNILKNSNEPLNNIIVSPLAVQMAMGLLVNGSKNKTQKRIIDTIGMESAVLNDYLKTYIEEAPKDVRGNINFVNAFWLNAINTGLDLNSVYKDRIQEYLGAQIKQEPFSQGCEVVMNNWIKEETNGMVNSVVRQVNSTDWLYMMNIATFDMDWEQSYDLSDIKTGSFNNDKGDVVEVETMTSVESLYIEDNDTTGFIKNYYIPRYKFIGILPDKENKFDDYISKLDSRKLIKLLEGAEKKNVKATIPAFESIKTVNIRRVLSSIGLADIFAKDADYSGMLKNGMPMSLTKIYHTSKIRVGKKSSEAAIVTNVASKKTTEKKYSKEVVLDRPFIYIIFDTEESIPIFIGTIKNITPLVEN